ncbi:MAG TPA: nucleoside triphosphate pyrophosphohydrolase [Candidatus Kapabacteria bacterium]|nr:nucleoside triphosphate pyrophosphohydrolase [Candidatus Kapabacteria bacterium]
MNTSAISGEVPAALGAPALQTTTLVEFLSLVGRLRRECPWDREQTHQSLRPMLIEEAYETVEAIDHAIDTGDYTELKKELGDLLLHILFHSDLAREEGHFTLDDVIQAECEKLIYRHPHVFSDVKVEGAEHVSRNWEQLKRREKGRNSILDGVPASLPALQRAQRIQERASKVGFDWPNSEGVWKKIREEVSEFEDELGKLEHRKEEEFGDLLFSLVNLARHEGLDAEGALRQATQKFDRRFRGVEAEAEASGKPMQDFTLEELDAIWDRVKRQK